MVPSGGGAWDRANGKMSASGEKKNCRVEKCGIQHANQRADEAIGLRCPFRVVNFIVLP
jgi:hypothetical protein